MAIHQHRRGWLVGLAGASLIASGFGATVATASPPADMASPGLQTEKAPASIDAQVQEELDAKGSAEFWVHFAERPDLTQFASIADWDARGEAVYQALRDTAEKSQADVRAQLDEQGVSYQHFYISNVIKVDAGDAALVTSLAADKGVDRIIASFEVEQPDDVLDEPQMSPTAVEWGVADINADDVWSEYGVTGEGIVVANIDTGVQYDHPALVSHYRGNNGDGTFDHNYNWLEVQGSSDFPTDYDGHGSHTMGTMIGDDGGENQIGVAPGATWIATSGCCPSDAALLESMEWVLAPTDLNGENADASKRPHIVNNSWGTTLPSNDPFGEEWQEAWNASGIFGVFANGNSGSACNTSGSPGSRAINYSVGNYTSSHVIAPSSSRGAGQDGVIKPNISAPGSNVRSSVPGNGYASYTGTSMAAPHAAGAVALLWSGAPSLVGDIDATRALLNGTAIDTEDLQCGGTAENNNVFGEGRLDVLAAMEEAPTGDTGTLTGTITDASTGDPISGAAVHISGDIERDLTTNDEGKYNALLTAGDYDVDVSAFGYGDDSATATVVAEETTTQDFALEPAEAGTISGTVTDASGHGWPLYAAISIEGTPVQAFSDPETGEYTVEVPAGTTYTLKATAQYPGYTVGSEEVEVTPDAAANATVDFGLTVDSESCTAPGYQHVTEGVSETFDGTEVPDGWTVTDDADSGSVWVFDDPGSRGNLTGGEGGFAIIDSDNAGSGVTQDTSLVSPSIDMSSLSDPVVGFKHDYNAFLGAGESGSVEVSTDGGSTWTTLESYTADTRGEVVLPAPDAAGESDVQVRFHYEASYDYWWQVDDVFLGNRACEPIEGGLVVGNVYDLNTGDGIVGASVTNLDNEDEKGVTAATEADENLDDGYYWLFSGTPGSHAFEAAARNYESKSEDITVVADDVVRGDFELGAGHLMVTPESIDTEVDLGDSATEDLVISNDGTGAVDVVLEEIPGDFELLRADGTRMTRDEIAAAEGAPEIKREVETSFAAAPANGAAGDFEAEATPSDEPWVDLGALPATVMDNRVVSLDGDWYSIGGTDGTASRDTVLKYDNEALAWTEVAPLPAPGQAVSVGAINGQLVVAGGWSDGDPVTSTYIYDPDSDAWTEGAEAPSAVSAAGQAVAGGKLYTVGGCTTADCTPMGTGVAAYDVASDSWTELADYPAPVAFASCGGIGDAIYCTGGNGGAAGTADSYVYDTASDTWSAIADAPVDTWASNYAVANGQLIVNGGVQGASVSNTTFAYDPETDAWEDLPNSNTAVYRGGAACGFAKVGGSSGGFTPTPDAEQLPGYDECGSAGGEVDWLELSQTEFTVPAGEEVTVEVTTNGDVPQPGTYSAAIRVSSNAPGAAPEVPVTMTVNAPLFWGKLQGLVQGETCEGEASPLAGAGVDISPNGDHPGWFLTTTAEGTYATWFDTRVGESDVTATKDGYRPESAAVTVPRGETVTQDFDLLDASCVEEPGPVHPDVVRLSGSDRYGTAAAISGLYDESDTVFVATGRDYPDALASAALAGSVEAPVLLTRPDFVPPQTLTELGRLGPANVIVLGGTSAVSNDVLEAIGDHLPDADISRLRGSDRYETAAAIAQEFDSADVVYVATGRNYPDALAGAARAGALDGPVLLVRPDEVPFATETELNRLNPTDIKVLGGTEAVSEDVVEALGEFGAVERLRGDTRYETAVQISADYETNANVFVASGQNWPDALAGAARAGLVEAPVLLTKPTEIPDSTWAELERLKPGTVYVLGGTTAVSTEVAEELATLE
ncbi:hypothetical protein GCM10009583_05630 [Ornithinicoccus hortensis]